MTEFGWSRIVRIGLVQACLGSIVVLTTSTLNRVMVVELALPALLPGLLVALHYAVQMARPRMGFGSDVGQRRTPWIVGGMAVLGTGGVVAASSTLWLATQPVVGILVATLGFVLVGLGVSAAGTSLLVLLAKRVPEGRRAGAATLVWMMMILGFALTAGITGRLIDPFSPERLVAVSGSVSVLAFVVTLLVLRGLEGRAGPTSDTARTDAPRPSFRQALGQIWDEPVARRFTVFVFVSMIAFSAQDLILEPFAGTVFGFTPGESTRLSGLQNAGVLTGMLLVAAAGALGHRWAHVPGWRHVGSLRAWAVGGCMASALALGGLTLGGLQGPGWPLSANVFLLGVCNGAFSIGAIGSMMALASQGRHGREGVRMGLWGAAQAIGFALGGLLGTAAADLSRAVLADTGTAYAVVFGIEALAFVAAAALAARVSTVNAQSRAAGAAPRRTDAFPVPTASLGQHQRPAA